MELSEFSGLVSNVSRKFKPNSVFDVKDVEQELWIKLLDLFPTLEELPRGEAFSLAKAILKNRMIDIARFYTRRKDTSIYAASSDDNVLENLINEEICDMFEFITPSKNQEKNLIAKQLFDDVNSWVKNKSATVKRFIKESLKPSLNIGNQWEFMKEEYPPYKRYYSIPPITLGRLLGISKKEVGSILWELHDHLVDKGYKRLYLAK